MTGGWNGPSTSPTPRSSGTGYGSCGWPAGAASTRASPPTWASRPGRPAVAQRRPGLRGPGRAPAQSEARPAPRGAVQRIAPGPASGRTARLIGASSDRCRAAPVSPGREPRPSGAPVARHHRGLHLGLTTRHRVRVGPDRCQQASRSSPCCYSRTPTGTPGRPTAGAGRERRGGCGGRAAHPQHGKTGWCWLSATPRAADGRRPRRRRRATYNRRFNTIADL